MIVWLPIKSDSYFNYSNANQATYLLAKNEWNEYKKLREYASEKDGLFVRRFESWILLNQEKGRKNYVTLKNKIQSKHVDFVICDMHLNIKPYWNWMIEATAKRSGRLWTIFYVQFYIAWYIKWFTQEE